MQRLLAFLLIISPIILSVLGIKLIRDFFFFHLNKLFPNLTIQLLIGIIFLTFGLYIIGSFILFRDKKRNKVQSRFK